jgi:A118 family predicted phage portal protein
MKQIWAKVLAFFAKILGVSIVPPEVSGADDNILRWWEVYRCKAPWLSYDYVTASGKKKNRTRLSLNMPKVLCSEMAGLVLAEPPTVDAGDLVAGLITREELWKNLRKSTEWAGATGGQVLKVLVSSEGEGEAKKNTIALDFVKAQSFIPLAWDNTEVYEGAFVDRRVVGKKALVRVETHRRAQGGGYTIKQAVFDEATGLEVPLAQFDPNLEPETTVPAEATSLPLFAYIPNPEANNIEPESPLGISLYANALDTLKAIDTAFDSMHMDVVLGKPRVALPGTVMRGYVDAEGVKRTGFDPDEEVYLRLEGDDADKMKPTPLSTDLHPDEYKTIIQTNLKLLAMQTGFDAGYFSFDGESVKTATEVISDNSHTYKTMQAFRDNLSRGLMQIFQVINELGTYYKIEGADKSKAPTIQWDDSVIEDRNSKTVYWTNLATNKLVDRTTALQKIHGIDEEAAKAMAAKISKETAIITSDSLFGAGA